MKIITPQPFTFEEGKRAVLLLHGFTGHSADVRMLGRYLQKKGYTTHAPIYRGHGAPPEEIIKYKVTDWWEDVKQAVNHLQKLGYEEFAVAGLSLGGVFSLKLAYSMQVKGAVSMCAPMFFDNQTQITQGFRQFAKEYKQLEGKDANQIQQEVEEIMNKSDSTFESVKEFIQDVHDHIDLIYTPTFIVQARKDEMINPESANYIYETIEAEKKYIKWYEESGHVITIGKEKEQLFEDIYNFLEELDWSTE
jgi:carboxylesterase